MKVLKINFDDPKFISMFNRFCFESKPITSMECSSINLRIRAINEYMQYLKDSSEFFIAVVSDSGEYIYSAFFKRTDDNFVNLLFALPNHDITSDIKLMRACWCLLANECFEHFGLTEIRSDIFRKHKLKSYIKFIKRSLNIAEYIENKNKEYDSIRITKELVIKYNENLQI